MTEHERLMEAVDQAIWELGEALADFPDADLWKRPHERLLSVGEIAAHVAYWEASSFFSPMFKSPLVTLEVKYYPSALAEPHELKTSAEEVLQEIQRIHAACREWYFANLPDLAAVNTHRGNWTWAYTLQYLAFHVAYHAGQIYSVRHLLAHATVDN